MSREQFHLVLEPLPSRPGEPTPTIRLRQLLKVALRGFKLRCIDVRQDYNKCSKCNELAGDRVLPSRGAPGSAAEPVDISH